MIKKSLKYIKEYIQYVILLISIIIGVIIRAQGINKLKSAITGQYLPQALDPYYFLRIAEQITAHGLPAIDLMRSFPLGQPLTHLGSLMSYFLILWNKFVNIFSDLTLQHSTIIFPIAMLVLSSIVLFFLIRRLLNWKVAALSVFIFNIISPIIHRTSIGFSDHDIIGLFFMLLTLYLFIAGMQNKKIISTLLLGLTSGLTLTIGILTAGNVKIVMIIISIVFLIKILLNKINEKEKYFYISWLMPITLIGIISGQKQIALSSISLSSTGILAYLLLITILIQFLFEKTKLNKYLNKIKGPKQLKYLGMGILLSFILGLIIAGKGLFKKIGSVFSQILSAFSQTRHTTTVAENQSLSFNTLIGNFGWLFFIFFLIGTWIILSKTTKDLGQKRNFNILYGTYLLIFLISKAFSIDTLLIISTIGFVISLIWLFIKRKNKKEYKIKSEYLFLSIWIITLTYIVSFAARLTFEFTPIFVIVCSFFIIWLFERIFKEKRLGNIWLKIGISIVIALIIIAPFGLIEHGTITSHYKESKKQAGYIGPGMSPQWQYASEWAKKNTPENAVFAHWWDYGYWVQYGFKRSTLTDGGNQINLWNYYIGREVLTGKTLEEPLKFLKAHNTTHLLIVADEIGKYGAFSLIGSDENLDRFAQIGTLGLNQKLSQETQTKTILTYAGGFALDEDIIYNNKIYSKSQYGVSAISITLKRSNNNQIYLDNLEQPIVHITNGQNQASLRLKCLYIQNKKIEFKDYDLEGCFRIMPVWTDSQNMNNLGAGLYLSKKVYDTVFARIYLMNETSPHYKLVYTDESNTPLSIYQNRIIGPIRIWEINYPKNLTLTKEEKEFYLATSFKEVGLESIQ